jgi:DNA-binding PadR family transcriptional regulator
MYPWTHLPAPLSPQEFHLLLALAHGESHAYKLKGQIEKDSLGSLKITDSTLYPLLARLHGKGLVDMVSLRPVEESGKSRKHYALSEEGTICLKEELTRLRHVAKMSESMGIFEDETPPDIARMLLRAGRDDS